MAPEGFPLQHRPSVDYRRLDSTEFAHSRVGELSCLIVGAGALGNEVAKTLGLLGVGSATIIDPDRVETSNLTRSVLFRTQDAVGRNKAEAFVSAAGDLFPDTVWNAVDAEIADVGFGHIRRNDLLFGCVDNDAARMQTAYIATKLDLPLCDGGLGGSAYSRGRVSWYPGRAEACAGCRLRDSVRRRLLEDWRSERLGCWAEGEGHPVPLPSTPTMAAVVGAAQVEVGLRRFFEQSTQGSAHEASSIEIALAPEPGLEQFEIPRSRRCPFHDEAGPLLEPRGSFGEMLARVGGAAMIVLDWPWCLSAGCNACEHGWEPRCRAGRVGVCPRCGSEDVKSRETIAEIRADSPWATRSPEDLGLPAEHLYTCRTSRLSKTPSETAR